MTVAMVIRITAEMNIGLFFLISWTSKETRKVFQGVQLHVWRQYCFNIKRQEKNVRFMRRASC